MLHNLYSFQIILILINFNNFNNFINHIYHNDFLGLDLSI
jgi:hypothetical protein